MPVRTDVMWQRDRDRSVGPDLDPPDDRTWPGWALRARRRHWTALPVLELCGVLFCLAALLSLSQPDTRLPWGSPAEDQSAGQAGVLER